MLPTFPLGLTVTGLYQLGTLVSIPAASGGNQQGHVLAGALGRFSGSRARSLAWAAWSRGPGAEFCLQAFGCVVMWFHDSPSWVRRWLAVPSRGVRSSPLAPQVCGTGWDGLQKADPVRAPEESAGDPCSQPACISDPVVEGENLEKGLLSPEDWALWKVEEPWQQAVFKPPGKSSCCLCLS